MNVQKIYLRVAGTTPFFDLLHRINSANSDSNKTHICSVASHMGYISLNIRLKGVMFPKPLNLACSVLLLFFLHFVVN